MSRMQTDLALIGGLSDPAKMPCLSYSIPAIHCRTGAKLAQLPGTVCSDCYALKGSYRFPGTAAAMERRWNILQRALTDPTFGAEWVKAFSRILEAKRIGTCKRIARGQRVSRDGRVFRWHDSGDLQGIEHLRLIVAVADATPCVRFWLPTREAGVVKRYLAEGGSFPPNLLVRLSIPRVGQIPAPAYLTLAEDPCVTISGVHAAEGKPAFGMSCVAYRQNGECRDCRACWDRNRSGVSYPLH